MRSQEYNIFKSLEFNDREYTKFKNKMLETVINNEWGNYTTAQILDAVIVDLATGKTDINSFYYSDMVPYNDQRNIITYSIFNPNVKRYEITSIFNDTELSNQAVLVYLNGTQLVSMRQLLRDLLHN